MITRKKRRSRLNCCGEVFLAYSFLNTGMLSMGAGATMV